MINFHIITIFPDAIKNYFDISVLARAQKKKLIKINLYNPRDFTSDRHKKVDDRPFGGGPGMVMKVEPILKTIQFIKSKKRMRNTDVILLSPSGRQFNQKIAKDFANKYKDIIIICGRYEGMDERIKKVISDLGFRVFSLSVGPYVLSGGELAAAIIVDAVSRHIFGVLGKEESLEEKRFGIGVPVYTRPEIFEFKNKKYKVPKVLLSGNHEKIKNWKLSHKK